MPDLPSDASDDEHFHLHEKVFNLNENQGDDEDAIYINTRISLPGRTSTNDSGLGGSTTVPQDYANAQIRMFFFFIMLARDYFEWEERDFF